VDVEAERLRLAVAGGGAVAEGVRRKAGEDAAGLVGLPDTCTSPWVTPQSYTTTVSERRGFVMSTIWSPLGAPGSVTT
jgi:hypothetical protein